MIAKTTKLEKYLGFTLMFFLINRVIKWLPAEAGNELMIYLLSASGLFAVIKIIRFYKQANSKINSIWFLSAAIIFTGVVLLLFEQRIGLGIGAVGTALFWLTYHSSFLANQPDIV